MRAEISVRRAFLSEEDFKALQGTRTMERMIQNKLRVVVVGELDQAQTHALSLEMRNWFLNQCKEPIYLCASPQEDYPGKATFVVYFANRSEATAFMVSWAGRVHEVDD